MIDVPLDEDHLRFAGVLDVDRSEAGVVLRRLPAWTRSQIVHPTMLVLPNMLTGVRLEVRTEARHLELDATLTLLQIKGRDVTPAGFDLVVDGRVADQQTTTDGTVIVMDSATGGVELLPGGPVTVSFGPLPEGPKRIDLYLPHASAVTLLALRADAEVAPPPSSTSRRWLHHGSSISHCLEAEHPTGVWPVVAARRADVDLISLAFAGECQLDQYVARSMRDAAADLISIKVGINLVNADSMRERTFVPAVHGFLDTIRDGHPVTPIAVVTPILCPAHEVHPGPTVTQVDGPISVTERPPALAVGALTVGTIRELLAEIVATRVANGDENLHLLDGRELFGEADLDDLPDGLHPNAAGYQRMGERFHALAFGDGGPFAP